MGERQMKTGPALKQLTSHRSIHDAGQAQARALTEDVMQLFEGEQTEDCLQAANILVQHWEEKIIAHADAEDETFFQELLASEEIPDQHVYMMMRDHDLFRKITTHIKESLKQQQKVTMNHIYEFNTLLILNAFHHEGEEEYLFPGK